MSFKTLILAILTLTACKTPAQRSESSVQGLAADPQLDNGRGLGCRLDPRDGLRFEIYETATDKLVVGTSAALSERACKEAIATAGRGGLCHRDDTNVTLVLHDRTYARWRVTTASPADVIWAECTTAARIGDDTPKLAVDEVGHQGLKCEKNQNNSFDLLTSKRMILAHKLSLLECRERALNSRNGYACVSQAESSGRSWFAIRNFAGETVLAPLRDSVCQEIVRTSGPSGLCFMLGDTVNFKFDENDAKTWKNAQRSPSELTMCQQMAAVPRGPLKANPVTQVEPAPVRTEFKGVVSQNPTFLPGTAKARLFVQVEGAELLVTVDNATKIELGTRDLSQLVGMSVVVEGTDAGNGELVATRIREAI